MYKYAFGRWCVLEEHHQPNKNSQRGFLRRNFLFRLSVSLCFCHLLPQIPSLPLCFPAFTLQRAFLAVSYWNTISIGATIFIQSFSFRWIWLEFSIMCCAAGHYCSKKNSDVCGQVIVISFKKNFIFSPWFRFAPVVNLCFYWFWFSFVWWKTDCIISDLQLGAGNGNLVL